MKDARARTKCLASPLSSPEIELVDAAGRALGCFVEVHVA
jgi:hypothetical protein